MAGNIVVIEATDNFQKVSRKAINNPEIDPLSLGIYVKILSLSKEWSLNVKGLASSMGVSEDKVRNCFKVLEQEGFLRRTRAQGEHGHFSGWDYTIYADPTDIAKTPTSVKTDIGKNRHSENTDIGEMPHNIENNNSNNRLEIKHESEGGADAPALAHTKNEGTAQEGESLPPKPQNPEGEPTEATAEVNQSPSPKLRRTPSPREFVPPTIEEVEAYGRESGYIINARLFIAHYEAVKWMMGKNKIKDWKAAVRQWWLRDHPNEKPTPAKAKPARPTWEQLGMTEEQWQKIGA